MAIKDYTGPVGGVERCYNVWPATLNRKQSLFYLSSDWKSSVSVRFKRSEYNMSVLHSKHRI